MAKRPLSFISGRDPEVLQTMLDFYANPGARVLDVTANKRRMWKGVKWDGPVTFSDIDASVKPDLVCDFRELHIGTESVDVLIFDPPHLPAAAGSQKSMKQMASDYGLRKAPRGNNISPLFCPFLEEATRVLRPDGILLAKLSDYVHNHRYQWMLVEFVNAVRQMPRLTACDLVVKNDPCGGNLKSGKWKNAYHVRNAHCWWIVVRKGGCEPKKGSK